MLSPERRLELWSDYRKRISDLFNDVECDLHEQFAPYSQSEADKDTASVRKLFDMLADVSAYVDRHTYELEDETSPTRVEK